MSDEAAAPELAGDDPVAVELRLALRGGDVETVRRLLGQHPGLARVRLVDRHGFRTPLHVVADWPGYFPNGPDLVRLLIGAGADPNARDPARCPETPLHWAASSDDVDVAAALIDGGSDPGTPGGSIGTPLANAVCYGCWHVARLLVVRGAVVGSLWEAAALGDRARVDAFLTADPAPGQDDLDEAFFQACHGGQRRLAEYLLALGADINSSPGYAHGQTPLQVAGHPDTRRGVLVDWLRERGAR